LELVTFLAIHLMKQRDSSRAWTLGAIKVGWLLGALLARLCVCDLSAALIAYDGANYDPTDSINGLNGGTGWQAGWSGFDNIVAASLTINGVATTGNHFVTDGNSGSVRVLDTSSFPALVSNGKFGKKGTTLWLSFLFRPEQTDTNNYAGLNLYDGTDQRLYVGVATGQPYLSLYAPPSSFRLTSIVGTNRQTFLLVVKMSFGTPSGDQAILYVNPPVDSEPTNNLLLTAALSGLDFQFDRVIFASGTTAGTTASFDEIRLGETFTDVVPLASNRLSYVPLHLFGNTNQMASAPLAGLVEGDDGALYGTTLYGGTAGLGTVFKVNKDGTGYRLIWNFQPDQNGQYPNAIVRGSDGALYGTCGNQFSGVTAATVFKLSQDGSGFTVLHKFTGPTDGIQPTAGLVEGTDHAFYGTTLYGGTNNLGTVFKVNPDGNGYQILYEFQQDEGDYPMVPLVEGQDGALYGTTTGNNNGGHGTIFKLNKDGTGYNVLHSFSGFGADLSGPQAGLLHGSDGALYGVNGIVFKIAEDGGGFTVLASLPGSAGPFTGALIEGRDGALYGTSQGGGAPSGSGTVFKLNKDGNNFAQLHSFDAIPFDGEVAHSPLLLASDGALYGTTSTGGAFGTRNGGNAPGDGTVYKINPDGSQYAVVQSFNSAGGDGGNARPGLIQGSDGALYGMTQLGGAFGVGSVFKINHDGSGYAIIKSLNNSGGDGQLPWGALLEGSDGALYGNCVAGGLNNYGTVFKLNKDGSGYTNLHDFQLVFGTDAENPLAHLIEGKDGALYGTTHNGGTPNTGYGAIYKLNKDGSGYAVLKGFTLNGPDGSFLDAPLLQASDLALYGTASTGGTNGVGTLFKINTDGSSFKVIHNFTRKIGDANLPEGGVIEGSDGALYGTAQNTGPGTVSVVFRVNKDGSGFTIITGLSGDPYGELVEWTDQMLYGTTSSGGVYGAGTLFRVAKDGSSFELLRAFSRSGTDGQSPFAGFIKGNDGGLYGTTALGGYTQGTVFKLAPMNAGQPPLPGRLALLLSSTKTVQISLSGTPLASYHLQYATQLPPVWQPLVPLQTDSSGNAQFGENVVPGQLPRFYRALAP
jgi:uncharacterized repeat protein (TIGR03803 family)